MKRFVSEVGKIEKIANETLDSFECILCRVMAYEPQIC